MLSLPNFAPQEHLLQRAAPTDKPNSNRQQPASVGGRYHEYARHSSLAQLHMDETFIELRKYNVVHFGAGWLRPPGITKTLQSKLEEAQEAQEQAQAARREAELRAQEEAAQQAEGGLGAPDGAFDQEERDLDAEIPAAEPDSMMTDEGEEEEYEETSLSFNDNSMLQGSPTDVRQRMPRGDEVDLDASYQEDADLEGAVDLDDDVPEAGEYEHTDTELEDSSSVEDEENEDQTRVSQLQTRSFGRDRRSLLSEASEIFGSSSFIGSSPALRRGRGNRNSTGRS